MEKTLVLLSCFQKRCYWSCLLETHKMPEFTDTYHWFPSYKLILYHISRPLSSSMESDTGFSLSIRRHLKLIRKCSTVMRLKVLTGSLYGEQWYRWEICISSYHYKLVGNKKAKVLFSENLNIVEVMTSLVKTNRRCFLICEILQKL